MGSDGLGSGVLLVRRISNIDLTEYWYEWEGNGCYMDEVGKDVDKEVIGVKFDKEVGE